MSNYFDASGTIGFTCDNCGREIQGCTWVNGMRFCAKCYQETFGNNTYQFVDLLNKEMYELKIANLEKQITDLEAKLAESEKFMQANGFKNWEEAQDALNGKFECIFDEKHELWKKLVAENAQLKQQLAEWQDGTIICKWTDAENKVKELEQQLAEKEKEIERLKIYDEYRFEQPYPKVKILGKTFEDIQELLDKWVKQGSKDKISFAVEQLKKVKDYAQHIQGGLINYIDSQIKQLKEGK